MRQLKDKGFPNILWLRTPDPDELNDHLRTTVAPKQRVMTLWRTTVLDAVQKVCKKYGCTGAMVVEDTVLLRKDVTYHNVAAEIKNSGTPAGVWGYGNKWEKKNLY